MAYFIHVSKIIPRQMKLPKQYKLIEVLAMINNDVLFVGIYKPLKVTGSKYYSKLEKELNSICMWATCTMESKTVILTGDLNLDILRSENIEGQLLVNLVEVYILANPGTTSRDDAIFSGKSLLEELKSPWELILTKPVPEVVEFHSADWAEKYFSAQSGALAG